MENEKKQRDSRISVMVPPEFLQDLKKAAVIRGVTIKRYVTGAILNQIEKDFFKK